MKIRRKDRFRLGGHLVLLLCIATVLSLVGCDSETAKNEDAYFIASDDWFTLNAKNLGFRIEFPKEPTERVQNFDSGGATATAYIYGYKHVAFEYGVTVVKLPKFQVDNSRPEVVLEYAVQSLVHELGGTLIKQYDININGYPGRRVYINYPDSFLKDVRLNTVIILRNNLVYRVTTSGLGNEEQVSQFLNSFTLVPLG